MLIHQVFVAYDIIIITLVLSSNRHNNDMCTTERSTVTFISFGKVSSNKLKIKTMTSKLIQ